MKFHHINSIAVLISLAMVFPVMAQDEPNPLAPTPPDSQESEVENDNASEEPAEQPDDAGVEEITLPTEESAPDGEAAGEDEAAGDDPLLQADGGFNMTNAELNNIFQFLAKQAGRQYFHNASIAGPQFQVTGHLNDGDPLQQMEELAFMYGLMLYTKGDTVYALTNSQLNQLPSKEFTYQLRYLRPSDFTKFQPIIASVLSPSTGIVNFEEKTNTIVIIDTAHRIEQAEALLAKIDKPKGQIIVETKILRINSSAAERVGVNWSSSLGQSGTSLEIIRSLNGVFGIDSALTTSGGTTGSALSGSETSGSPENLVLSPLQLNGVLRALGEGGIATQISNPTLITEDNERGTISIIDRVPIITTTTNQGTSTSSVSEEVRYKIDTSDPSIVDDPQNHREIGISMVVTPTLLPDGTIRMDLRPRSAQITDEVRSATTSNVYPRVTESMIESISRVPDGHSLVVGGFYGEIDGRDSNKVPLLGDIPILNFFFKSRETSKEQTSLVFIVTPTSYDPASKSATKTQSGRIHDNMQITQDHEWVDPQNPGPAHKPNLRRTIRGLEPKQEPYYPTPEELEQQRRAAAEAQSQSSANDDDQPRFNRTRRR